MTTEVWKNEKEQRFEIWIDGVKGGFLDYSCEDDTYVLPHTEVFEKFGGSGVGSQLVVGVLEQIRDEGAQALPYCPFVPKVIRDHPEFVGLVPEAERARFGLDEKG